jgi:transposase
LIADYREGVGVMQLASAYGVHRDTVRGYLNDSQVERRQRSLTTDRQREAVELYRSGRTLEEVADLIGTSKWTVQRVLGDHGVDRRPAARRLAS